jgi:rhodanese-related sulfurtransferase
MEFIQKNIFLVVVALVSGAMLLWPLLRRGTGGPWVSTLEATQLMNRGDAIVIDLRTAEEFARGHVLGARSLPLADFERRAAELEKHKAKPVIVYASDPQRARGAVAALRKLGFGSVHNLTGGYAAWQQAGLPVEK